jgi:hypothetical protein
MVTSIHTLTVVATVVTIFTLVMEAILSSETSVLARATRRHIPEDGVFLSFFCGMKLSALGTSDTIWPIVPAQGDG